MSRMSGGLETLCRPYAHADDSLQGIWSYWSLSIYKFTTVKLLSFFFVLLIYIPRCRVQMYEALSLLRRLFSLVPVDRLVYPCIDSASTSKTLDRPKRIGAESDQARRPRQPGKDSLGVDQWQRNGARDAGSLREEIYENWRPWHPGSLCVAQHSMAGRTYAYV
ncbi:hypothetical protein F4859DRAFT_83359 [Xylaria cf. heliscus]|nr:hypothetical protein F4859DRAFT_83359 [Xylaria cf. heliscus]